MAVLSSIPLQAQSNYATPYSFWAMAGAAGNAGSVDGAGSGARFSSPQGVAVDGSGNVYVADTGNQTIRKITSAGVVTTFAGLAGVSGSADGPGGDARFFAPGGVAVDGAGNVYVAECNNHTIRKITPAGVVTTLAGLATAWGAADGMGSAARFSIPSGVAADGMGNVYVADANNHTIRKITPAGEVSTLAGLAGSSGSADGTGNAARFNNPLGVAVDSSGNVYVTDQLNQTIRKITPAGAVTTLAGFPSAQGSADGIGSAARFGFPHGVAVDAAGDVYVGERVNRTVRKITGAGVVTTLAGLAETGGSTDGTGNVARFNLPRGVAVDGAGNVYVADSANHTIRQGRFLPPAPGILTQPVSQAVIIGDSVTFSAAASGYPAPTYQWRKDGFDLGGATGPTLTISTVQPGQAGDYVVVATNAAGSATSSVATLTVIPIPVIVSQSPSRTVLLPGQSLTLHVSATGPGPLSYQWTRNNRPLAGATGSSLALSDSTWRDGGAYGVLVTNSHGTRRSATMFVAVVPAVTQVRAWGNPATKQTIVPPGLNDVMAFSTGGQNVLALKRDGTVKAWGDITPSKLQVLPGGLVNVVAVASGYSRCLVLKSNGRVSVWGSGPDVYGLSNVTTLTDVVAIAAANLGSVALLGDGTVVGSGYGYLDGQATVAEAGFGNTAIATSGTHSLALKSDGTVVAWGDNTFGQTDVPAGLGNVTAIATGFYHSLALKSDGTVVAWGKNESGQAMVPAGLDNVVGISADGLNSLAVKSDGTVVAWGDNQYGQATPPADLANAYAVTAGNNVAFALRDASHEGPPVIVFQPVGATLAVGRTVMLSATVAGAQPLTYRWTKDGVDIPGATESTYTIPSAAVTDSGSYLLVATNALGTARSNAAGLTVSLPPSDYNADGQADLLWQNRTTGLQRIWLMNGSSKASEVNLPGMGPDWQVVCPANFYSGGNDILVQNTVTGERAVRLMLGTGILIDGFSLGVVAVEWSMAGAADFNGDGLTDIVWENIFTGERGIWLLSGAARVGWVSLGVVGIQWSIAGTGDFNDDGLADLVWQNSLTGERKLWLMNGVAKGVEVSLGFVALEWSIGMVADCNDDGRPDVVWQNTVTGEHVIWLMNGTVLSGYAFLPTDSLDWVIGRIPLRPAVADLNHDGKSDLLWQNTATGERSVWLMDGTGPQSLVVLGTVGLPWQIASTGDMNGDGRCDILWQNTSTGERGVWLMFGTSLSGYVSLGTFSTDWRMVGTADFNGDNQADILWQNTATGESGIWLMAGTTLSGWIGLGHVSTDWQLAGVADFNRDDNPDLLWQNTSTGERKVRFMTGVNVDSEVPLGTVALAWSIAGTGDYNLDGSTDILWQNTSTGERGIWLLNGTALSGYVDLGIQPLTWQIAY